MGLILAGARRCAGGQEQADTTYQAGPRQRGMAMAEQDMKAVNQTYEGFLGLLKVGTIATVIVAVVVVLLISS